MTDWNETGFVDSDFLPELEREERDIEINSVPHEKRRCDPMYACKWHGNPEEGT